MQRCSVSSEVEGFITLDTSHPAAHTNCCRRATVKRFVIKTFEEPSQALRRSEAIPMRAHVCACAVEIAGPRAVPCVLAVNYKQ
ncbi:hypothetical protein C0Q70_05815 [Pomacea canaliculata]|uniref:Uncharacterized protein n=1 Tax=Pomacea canaliculata TaxID=400727 RepID=A0A2T7PM93_POMCA|nr:hypothetical protein C0Q70_05815 [Pomacea canaliculata]